MKFGFKKPETSLCHTVWKVFPYLEPHRRGWRVWQTDRRTDRQTELPLAIARSNGVIRTKTEINESEIKMITKQHYVMSRKSHECPCTTGSRMVTALLHTGRVWLLIAVLRDSVLCGWAVWLDYNKGSFIFTFFFILFTSVELKSMGPCIAWHLYTDRIYVLTNSVTVYISGVKANVHCPVCTGRVLRGSL